MKFTEYLRLTESANAVQPKNLEELKEIIRNTIKEKGPNCDLNFIDVSRIKDMSFMFYKSKFNGDISKWNVSNVKWMDNMFEVSNFSKDISKWKTNSIEVYTRMFYNCPLDNKPEYQPTFNF